MPFDATPSARLYLRKLDLDSGNDAAELTLQALFNPEQLELDLIVSWSRLAPKGLSHAVLQYDHTENQTMPLDLYWRVGDQSVAEAEARLGQLNGGPAVVQDVGDARRFGRVGQPTSRPFTLAEMRRAERYMLSLCYPRRGSATVAGGQPPRVLVVWPRVVSMVCAVTALNFRFTQFNSKAEPTRATSRIQLEEIRDARLTSEDVYDQGWLRADQGDLR